MKQFLTILSSLFILMSFSGTAHAGFLIEPFVDYAVSGKSKQGSADDDFSALGFGARLGMTTLGFMYGLEYATGNYTVKQSTGDVDGSFSDLGLFVGYEFPILIRAWISYYIQSKSDVDNSNVEYKGTGTKIGVGYTGLPFISINLQLLMQTYDEYEAGSLSGTLANDIKNTAYLLGVSLPLP